MNKKGNLFFLTYMLLFGCITVTYGQDCNYYLRRAAELFAQRKYCEAKKAYLQLSHCDADIDVSTEIAMCERYCKIAIIDDEDLPSGNEPTPKNRQQPMPEDTQEPYPTPSRSSAVAPPSLTSSFSGMQLHGGLFLPIGKFAHQQDDGKEYGLAALGYNIGLKYYIPIAPVNGLSLMAGLDAYYNGIHDDSKQRLRESVEGFEGGTLTMPAFLNIPVTGGANYAYAINNSFSVYGEAAVGLNISKHFGPSVSYSGDYYSLSAKEKYDIAVGFSYALEAGVLLMKHVTVGVRYHNLGAYKYKGKYEEKINGEIGENEDIKMDNLPISGISFSVGVLF